MCFKMRFKIRHCRDQSNAQRQFVPEFGGRQVQRHNLLCESVNYSSDMHYIGYNC